MKASPLNYSKPEIHLKDLSLYKGILSPDFSVFFEMTYTLQLYHTFRNRWCGAYFVSKGIRVIPTVSWADELSSWKYLSSYKSTYLTKSYNTDIIIKNYGYAERHL